MFNTSVATNTVLTVTGSSFHHRAAELKTANWVWPSNAVCTMRTPVKLEF